MSGLIGGAAGSGAGGGGGGESFAESGFSAVASMASANSLELIVAAAVLAIAVGLFFMRRSMRVA